MNTNWGSCDGTATHGQALAYGGGWSLCHGPSLRP